MPATLRYRDDLSRLEKSFTSVSRNMIVPQVLPAWGVKEKNRGVGTMILVGRAFPKNVVQNQGAGWTFKPAAGERCKASATVRPMQMTRRMPQANVRYVTTGERRVLMLDPIVE